MAPKFMKATVTFIRPFTLPGVEATLPSGDYAIEWKQKQLDGLPLPESPVTLIHLRLRQDFARQFGADTLPVSWGEFRRALARDRAPADLPPKIPIDLLVKDPLVQLVMTSDGISDFELRRTLRAARLRRRGSVALGGSGRLRTHANVGSPARRADGGFPFTHA